MLPAEDDRVLLQDPKGPARGSLSSTDTSGTVESAGTYGPRVEQLDQQPEPVAELSLVLGPTQWQLLRLLGKQTGVLLPKEEYVTSKI